MDKIGGMPMDWSNAIGWEEYYAQRDSRREYRERLDQLGSIPLNAYQQLAADLLAEPAPKVWLPGCGFSPIPKLLAQLGLTVHATDISPTAVQFQTSINNDISPLLAQLENAVLREGELIAEAHDFHQPYQSDFFDLIINIKAFQGFSWESMCRIAVTHYQALKPARLAYFDTVNVQGEKREQLEESLVKAGFFLPFYELTRAYRAELNYTGIPYVIVLGMPRIPRRGDYARDEAKCQADEQVLFNIHADYEAKKAAHYEAEKARLKTGPKQATIIYSTG